MYTDATAYACDAVAGGLDSVGRGSDALERPAHFPSLAYAEDLVQGKYDSFLKCAETHIRTYHSDSAGELQ